ncbi:type I restriction/modification system, M subunit [Campylobacter vicugnae]|uniref:site-specific DNA-methyltransferase (adenine-specific) n=1 Tax=Campylobacter vicugnae TaxID=1660076 RepID=A0A1X9T056_9BACT|nr:type I restriction-modification system subunit M N-terminal domain-containing protein [Campylobacter sp. RM8964]ARR01853.1 type I restriction/modification system, M subunit [Campylobacter sp. RM8964]
MQIDINKEVNFIWDIVDRLRGGAYKNDKYKDVIIPMAILRCFECVLCDTKKQVLEAFFKNKNTPTKILNSISGYNFYNTSKFDLKKLLNDQIHIKANLLSYIDGFSDNIKEILENLEFSKQIEKMYNKNCLYGVVQSSSSFDLEPKTVPNHKMDYIFEDLIRKFSENVEAGDRYIGRDIVKLMVDILIFNSDIAGDNRVFSVLDQAYGTGGMLSVINEVIKKQNPSANVFLYGQEINGESYTIYKADMLIKKENGKKDTATINKIIKSFSKIDKNVQIQRDKDGIIYDDVTKDSEIINIDISIDEYMKAEILLYLPNAKAFDEDKIGAEIPFTRYFYKYSQSKSIIENISAKTYSNMLIILSPLNEQEKIANFLDNKCEKIDKLNENYQNQILNLKEYKKSLIYEFVAGKYDKNTTTRS